ncbi:flavohemoprotein B5/b5r [Aspergillus bombycis]|uniref:Flavohemoprotein B5/b5r n=1 Tax=Aspergillus bombycis TaxID=109264 RepID=A0A1F7ZS99_9EURO|nr:flavohemoprotein B5/b5r [Aspergillus bombycis]OGM42341.1 flavohemoprotein B5/b5r [Aspergillus bombycis]
MAHNGRGQHVQTGFHFKDSLLFRPYAPLRPLLDHEEDGTLDLVLKTCFFHRNRPGGTMSNILDCLPEGEEVEVKSPSGAIHDQGHGCFSINDETYTFDEVSLILGGSSVTPGYWIIARFLGDKSDKTKLRVMGASTSENDGLMKDELE